MHNPAEREAQKAEYLSKIAAMDDDALVSEIELRVWHSARANHNGRSFYHVQCDASYDEAKRRGKPWLYQRGWNKTFKGEGHTLSEQDIALASPDHPSYQPKEE